MQMKDFKIKSARRFALNRNLNLKLNGDHKDFKDFVKKGVFEI